MRRAGSQMPILNSISPLRAEMFQLHRLQPFKPILLSSERNDNGHAAPNHTAEEVHQTAKELVQEAQQHGIGMDQCIIDPAICPIGADSEGNLKRLVGAMQLIHGDASLRGVHLSVGLSNFTVMLPSKCADGSPTKGPLESAFLTLAVPLGLPGSSCSVGEKPGVTTWLG